MKRVQELRHRHVSFRLRFFLTSVMTSERQRQLFRALRHSYWIAERAARR